MAVSGTPTHGFARWSQALAIAFGALVCAAPALAQAAAQACPNGRIVRVVIDNASIFNDSDPTRDRRFEWAYSAANALHMRTRTSVVTRELLFQPEDCFDGLLVDESARLLRAMPFLSAAVISPVQRGDGNWDVIVETQDAWSTLLDLAMRFDNGVQFEGFTAAEYNLLGTGHAAGLFYFERDVVQQYGVWVFTPQLLGTRLDLSAGVGRTRAGSFTRHEIAYPFVGEPGRWAARHSYLREDRLFDYLMEDREQLDAHHMLIPISDRVYNVAGLRRLGPTGSTMLVGAGLTVRRLDYTGAIQIAPSGVYDQRVDAPPELAAVVERQMQNLDAVRLSALLGHRSVRWVQRRGYDSMRGLQDIRLGSELAFELGRSIGALGGGDDLQTKLGLYTAVETGPLLLVARARADGRRDLEAPTGTDEWRDVYADVELLAYLRPGGESPHTVVLRASALGGWNTHTPFQFTLGGERALRGYDLERFPAGRRVLLSAEDRVYFGWPMREVFDLGATFFADLGQGWEGDVPFGVDSGLRGSLGFGLRGGFPAGSPVTIRLDAAWPLESDTRIGDMRIRLTFGESYGLTRVSADYLFLRSRAETVAAGLGHFRY